jgi:hypothetical protein
MQQHSYYTELLDLAETLAWALMTVIVVVTFVALYNIVVREWQQQLHPLSSVKALQPMRRAGVRLT